jgi:hypothetical protein
MLIMESGNITWRCGVPYTQVGLVAFTGVGTTISFKLI